MRISLERVVTRLGHFAPALRAMKGGLTISGGEPLVQPAFSRRIFGAAKAIGLHTALDTSGFLGARATDEYLKNVDLVLLDIKSWDPETYRRVTRQDLAPTLRFAERLAAMNKPVWVRFMLVPGLTGRSGQRRGRREVRRADEERRVGGSAAVPPARRVQMEGARAWTTSSPIRRRQRPELVARVLGQFRDAGCNAR